MYQTDRQSTAVKREHLIIIQGCGLGLDVSVSRRSRDVPTSRLGLDQSAQRLGLVSTQNVSGLGPFRLVETFYAGAPHLTTILQ